jgi:hypothetical protein
MLTWNGPPMSIYNNVFYSYFRQQMSEHIIHLYGVSNNMINEIPARGDNAGWTCNMILKTTFCIFVDFSSSNYTLANRRSWLYIDNNKYEDKRLMTMRNKQ